LRILDKTSNIVAKFYSAKARMLAATTRQLSPHSTMSCSNRFQALAEDEEPDLLQGNDPSMAVMDDAQQPQSGQQGWENDEDLQDLLDEEDSKDETIVIEDEQRRRKVSSGPRAAHVPNMTFAFDPVSTQSIPGCGRGGDLRTTPETIVGLLPPITEITEIEHEEVRVEERHNSMESNSSTTDAGGREQATMNILASSVTPTAESPEQLVTTFTFRAQLTWGLPPGTRVNLPHLFREWVKTMSKLIPDFALLHFDDEKGQAIVSPEQVPDDNPSFFQDYYYNHRVLNHGNMTGMVHFRCTVS